MQIITDWESNNKVNFSSGPSFALKPLVGVLTAIYVKMGINDDFRQGIQGSHILAFSKILMFIIKSKTLVKTERIYT